MSEADDDRQAELEPDRARVQRVVGARVRAAGSAIGSAARRFDARRFSRRILRHFAAMERAQTASSGRPGTTRKIQRQSTRTGLRGSDHLVDILVGVRQRDEHRLELRRAAETRRDPACCGRTTPNRVGVGSLRGRVVGDRARGEEQGQHRADPVHLRRDVGRLGRGDEAVAQPLAEVLEALVGAGAIEDLERLEARPPSRADFR